MWLFDNIFLDEEVTTAVVEKPEEEKKEDKTHESPTDSTVEKISTPDIFDAVMRSDSELPQDSREKKEEMRDMTDSQLETPLKWNPEWDAWVSFDIGGGIDIGSDLTFGGNITDISYKVGNPETGITGSVVNIPEETHPSTAASFTVNGVQYTTPESSEDKDTGFGSIAMIQWSTAASGINIMDKWTQETPTVEWDLEANTEVSSDITPSDDTLINILSNEDLPKEDNAETDITPTPFPENKGAEEEKEGEQPVLVVVDDVVPTVDISPIIELPEATTSEPIETGEEEAITEETPEKAIASVDFSAPSVVFDRFITELSQREKEINTTIIKMCELAKHRVEIEEEYKNRLLAISMEEEYLKNKAERERAEQDRLQEVVKSFQQQITLSE